jgi:cytochrome P450
MDTSALAILENGKPKLLSDALSYDLLAPEFQRNPYPLYAALRRNDPVYWSEQIQAWLVTPYEEVVACLHDKRISANRIIPASTSFPPGSRKSSSRWSARCQCGR